MAGKFDLESSLAASRERDLNRAIERAETIKSSALPYPDNRAANLAWFNREFLIDGEYKPSDGENCSIVAANVDWIYRSLLQVPLGLYSGDVRLHERHPVLLILKNPNRRHTYRNLLYGLVRSLIVSGDGLLEVLQTPELGLQVMPYQWLRQQLPQTKEQQLQYWMHSWTEYRKVETSEVAHLIWQPYDRNQVIGESPLVPVYAEIKLDRAAMEGAYGRLNSPVAGLVMSPKEQEGAPITAKEKEDLREQARDLKRTKAGQMLLVEGRFEVTELHGAVQKFTYKEFHDLAEERISGVLGIHPRVLYLGSGLKQTQGIGSSMDAEIRLSWQNGAIPFGEMLAEGLSKHLLPMLGYSGLELKFDFGALDFETEEEKLAKLNRVKLMEDYEYIDHTKALTMLGLDE